MELTHTKRYLLKLRYDYLNRTWVNQPAKLQLAISKEMATIRKQLGKDNAHTNR